MVGAARIGPVVERHRVFRPVCAGFALKVGREDDVVAVDGGERIVADGGHRVGDA